MSDVRPARDTADVIPETIGPYRIAGVLGRGGMGVVYDAVRDDGQRVALKVISDPELRPHVRSRFARESRLRVVHPNVVRVVDAGETESGVPFIALELLEGESLTRRMRARPLEIDEALRIAIDAARGIAAVHAAGIVHRDIKPGNLFWCLDGTVKVLDFGIAVSEAVTRLTFEESDLLGTPRYMSPEQVRGSTDVDPRTDVWSLGVVLYEMLTGESPFARDTPLATLLAVAIEEAAPVEAWAPDVSPQLSRVVERCLQKSRAARFAHAHELLSALEACVAIEAERASSRPPRAAPEDIHDREDTSISTRIERASIPYAAIEAGEQRLVVVLLATGLRDRSAVERAIVARGGGFVPLVQDQAVGVFGAEVWEGDEAARAVGAAQHALPHVSRICVAAGHATHSGGLAPEVLRVVESTMAHAAPGVVVHESVVRQLGGASLRSLGSGVFEVLAFGDPRRESVATGPLVGRSIEVAQLVTAVADSFERRRSRVVLVRGPTGIGKTRLVDAAVRGLTDLVPADRVLFARAEPLTRSVRFGLLASAFDSSVADAAVSSGRDSTFGRVARDDAVRGEPQLQADRVRSALFDWLSAHIEAGPSVFVVEGLQWADEASLDVLDQALEHAADMPFAIIGTLRGDPEDETGLWIDHDRVTVALRGLSLDEVRALAEQIAEVDLEDAFVRSLKDRTDGNPLFVEQTMLAMLDAESPLDASTPLPLPTTIEGAIQSRLDRIPRAERDACRRAAIFDSPIAPADLEALGCGSAEDLLHQLARRRLMVRRRRGSETRWEHASSLLHDVAYRTVEPSLRTELHRVAARHMEKMGATAEAIARHYDRAGSDREAAHWFVNATDDAEQRGDSESVLRCSTRALELGWEEPQALRFARADAAQFLGRYDLMRTELEAALVDARHERDRARAHDGLVGCYWLLGDREAALAAARASADAAARCGDDDLIALAHGRESAVHVMAGRIDEARASFTSAEPFLSAAASRTQGIVESYGAIIAFREGRLAASVEAHERSLAHLVAAGDLRRVATGRIQRADALVELGRLSEALRDAEEALAVCRKLRQVRGVASGLDVASRVHMLRGDVRHAVELAEAALAMLRGGNEIHLKISVMLTHATALLERGDSALAVEEAAQVVADARKHAHPALESGGASVLACGLRELGRTREALDVAVNGWSLFGHGSPIDESRLCLVYARLSFASGDESRATEVLAAGCRRLDALFDPVDEAHRRVALESVRVYAELYELAGARSLTDR